ncbi:hypothetical protein ACDQ55_14010 [Chitinophaga sp. 30R24]|uniref:hypothetical protein n=1 Tax=Chitinophaga sp. 30R24 TaxID=3248838 RepID=UPI003B8FBB83
MKMQIAVALTGVAMLFSCSGAAKKETATARADSAIASYSPDQQKIARMGMATITEDARHVLDTQNLHVPIEKAATAEISLMANAILVFHP